MGMGTRSGKPVLTFALLEVGGEERKKEKGEASSLLTPERKGKSRRARFFILLFRVLYRRKGKGERGKVFSFTVSRDGNEKREDHHRRSFSHLLRKGKKERAPSYSLLLQSEREMGNSPTRFHCTTSGKRRKKKLLLLHYAG